MNHRQATASCHACDGLLDPAAQGAFQMLHRVTSDCRPWPAGGHLALCRRCGLLQKPVDDSWRAEIEEIYAGYAIYHQSGGREQAVFTAAGLPAARSRQLLERAFSFPESALPGEGLLKMPVAGRMVDIGCGNGGLLRSFSTLAPGWTLAGTELSDAHRREIEAIPGVEALYVRSPDRLPAGFDLATLIHCLEHVMDPASFLRSLVNRMVPDGILLIEVPHWCDNPFDLLIADHCSHFTPQTLCAVVNAAGLDVEFITTDWIRKEISLIARVAKAGVPAAGIVGGYPGDADKVAKAVAWLQAVVDDARSIMDLCGVFGTAIGGVWLAEELGDACSFFVDEDPARIGSILCGRPVLHPRDVPEETTVYLALAPTVAEAVAARLGSPRYHLPPSLRRDCPE
jgi:SAM-dependent methyltransferase